jgi:hypothetical protein
MITSQKKSDSQFAARILRLGAVHELFITGSWTQVDFGISYSKGVEEFQTHIEINN